VQRKNRCIHGRAHLQAQRCVKRPSACRCATRHEERTGQDQSGRNHQPETEVVHAGKGHVSRANLQRDHPICKADKGWHDGAKHHDQTVHGGELVKQLGVNQLQTRLEQFCANAQSQNTTNDQHSEGKQQVQRANVFVVGRIDPTAPAVRRTMVVIVCVIGPVAMGVKYSAHRRFLRFKRGY